MPPLPPRAAALPVLLLALAACHDTPVDRAAGAPSPAPAAPIASGELRVAVQLLDSAAREARVALRLEHPGVRVGAYSGTARFDAAGVEVVDAAAGPGGGLVNASTGEEGAVRFAGFDVSGVQSDVVATVRLRVRDWGALARTTTELSAAATEGGAAVDRARLRQARGLAAEGSR